MKKKISIIVIVFILLVFGIFLKDNKSSKLDEGIHVGAIIPLTGNVATYGESLKKGFDLASEKMNGKIIIDYEDSKGSVRDGVSAIQKLLSQDVKYFLGDATSTVNLGIAPIAQKNNSLFMISIATSDDLSLVGDFVFRNCPPNNLQSKAALNFIKNKLKVRKVAVLTNKIPYSINLSGEFVNLAKKEHIEIVLEEEFSPDTKDYSTLIHKVIKAKPDALFVPSSYKETAFILRKARELGLEIPFVGTDGAYSPKLFEIAGKAVNGFYLTMMGVDKSNEFYGEFLNMYMQKYGEAPDIFSAYGYEGAMVLFSSLNSNGNPELSRKKLANQSWDGLLGKLEFDDNGEVIRDYQILKATEKSFVAYE